MSKQQERSQGNPEQIDARRRFLSRAGKFAVATPVAVTLLLADTKKGYAHFCQS